MTWWLLDNDVAEAMQRAWDAGMAPTAEQSAEFVARATSEAADLPRGMTVEGGIADIRVEGVLTEKPDFFAFVFGGGNTTYQDIRSSFALAASDKSVKRVQLSVNSPGGQVDGLFDTLAAIQGFSKPVDVIASRATSAAYAIAAVAGKIKAKNAAAEFGSIGVAASFMTFASMKVVSVTSTEAPNKRPDITTEEGQAVVREQLDAIHELFADAIATARGTTVKKVNSEFGRGATLLAGEARKRGMIDTIARPNLRQVKAEDEVPAEATARAGDLVLGSEDVATIANDFAAVAARVESLVPIAVRPPQPQSTPPKPGGTNGEKTTMTKEELRSQHPELYAAVLAEGIASVDVPEDGAEALKKERDRVDAHLTAGEQSGDMKTALAAVRDGSEMTQTLMTRYMMAGRNRTDRDGRQTETDDAAAAVEGADPSVVEKDLGDQVVAKLEQMGGAA